MKTRLEVQAEGLIKTLTLIQNAADKYSTDEEKVYCYRQMIDAAIRSAAERLEKQETH